MSQKLHNFDILTDNCIILVCNGIDYTVLKVKYFLMHSQTVNYIGK